MKMILVRAVVRVSAASLHLDLESFPGFGLMSGFGLGLGLAFEPGGVFAAGLPFGSLCDEALRGIAGQRQQLVEPRCPVILPGLRRRRLSLRVRVRRWLGARWGGQASPVLVAAWCWRAMAHSTVSESAPDPRRHPAVVCGAPSGWACGSSSGWAWPRRRSSARALPAVSLVAWVSAAHCSYRAWPASSRCRPVASRPARDLALAAPVVSCCTSAAADCWSASASACAEGAVSRSRPAARWRGHVRLRGFVTPAHRGAGRG